MECLLVIIEQQILHIDNTDDIIGTVLINRKSCKLILSEQFDQLLIGIVDVCKSHIDTRYHNLFCLRITKIKQIIDHVFLQDFNWKKFGINLGMGLTAILCMVISVLPYGLQKVISLYTNTVGSFEYASVNAYNFWTLCGKNWISQGEAKLGLTYQTWGTIFILLIIIATVFISFRCKKTEAKYSYIGAVLIIGIFMFSVRMHERYMYPAMAFLLLAYVMKPRRDVFILYCLSAMHFFYNVAHVLFKYDAANDDWHRPILFSISLLGMVVFLSLIHI